MSYFQKLILVQALGVIRPPVIAALEALNTVRNEFAHKISKQLTFQDVLRIGASLEKQLEEVKHKTGSDTVETLAQMLFYICGHLEGSLHRVIEEATSSLRVTKKT